MQPRLLLWKGGGGASLRWPPMPQTHVAIGRGRTGRGTVPPPRGGLETPYQSLVPAVNGLGWCWDAVQPKAVPRKQGC
jgi:hypothetical protein